MSNVIDLLEMIGQDARLRHASPNDIEQALLRAQIDPEVQTAILAKDQSRLEALLEGDNVCCMLFPSIECLMLFGTDTDEDDCESSEDNYESRQCA